MITFIRRKKTTIGVVATGHMQQEYSVEGMYREDHTAELGTLNYCFGMCKLHFGLESIEFKERSRPGTCMQLRDYKG